LPSDSSWVILVVEILLRFKKRLNSSVFNVFKTSVILGVKEFMPILTVTKVGKHYRTTIPREVRKILELKENDEIEWMLENWENRC